MAKRQTKRPSAEAVALIKQANAALNTEIVWGKASEMQINRTGAIHPEQIKRILKISIFDPWLKLVFGGFFVVLAVSWVLGYATPLSSWRFWLPLVIAIIPLTMAMNGFIARRKLAHAHIEILDGELDAVKQHRSEAVAATLHRDNLYMLLLNYEGAPALPKANTNYHFYVIFDVIRPGIVVGIEEYNGRDDRR